MKGRWRACFKISLFEDFLSERDFITGTSQTSASSLTCVKTSFLDLSCPVLLIPCSTGSGVY